MNGKTIVITGATSGIGEAGAVALARMGARIIFVARDRARGGAVLQKLQAANPSAAHNAHYADLSMLGDMKRVGADIARAEPRIDVLINNAGAIYAARGETPDGLERTFATNHMSYFVLTNALLDNLKATPDARIVSTASEAHRFGGALDFDDLQLKNKYRIAAAYGRSKLCNILFTRELAKRLAGSGVSAHCFHPGFVASNFGKNNGAIAHAAMGLSQALGFTVTSEKGADTMVWLASSPDLAGKSGGYFARRKPGVLAAFARDDAAAARLWDESARLAA